jgi:hypothetical protein
MTALGRAPATTRSPTSEERDERRRWNVWSAKGALAEARSHRQAQWLTAVMLGGTSLWLAFELMRLAA